MISYHLSVWNHLLYVVLTYFNFVCIVWLFGFAPTGKLEVLNSSAAQIKIILIIRDQAAVTTGKGGAASRPLNR